MHRNFAAHKYPTHQKEEIQIKTDTEIKNDVTEELKWNPSVTSDHIGIAVNNGIVSLTGYIPHYIEKNAAEEAAQRVSGVKAVANELEVKFEDSFARSDEDIATAAVDSLMWNYNVPEGIKVSVTKGWMTLRGATDWDYQRTAANDAVSSLMGVSGVSNEITLKTKVQPIDIKTRIEAALKRTAETEGKGISVGVIGNCVTLSGKVHTFAEKEDARFAAWSAPGVMTVENNLSVAA